MKYVEDGRVLGSEYWGQSNDANDLVHGNEYETFQAPCMHIEAMNASLASSIAFLALRCGWLADRTENLRCDFYTIGERPPRLIRSYY
jgi:hypothetical protein